MILPFFSKCRYFGGLLSLECNNTSFLYFSLSFCVCCIFFLRFCCTLSFLLCCTFLFCVQFHVILFLGFNITLSYIFFRSDVQVFSRLYVTFQLQYFLSWLLWLQYFHSFFLHSRMFKVICCSCSSRVESLVLLLYFRVFKSRCCSCSLVSS